MSFFQRLRSFFAGGATPQRYLPVYIYSRRCNEAMAGRIDLMNELSSFDADTAGGSEEGEATAAVPSNASWFTRKVFTTSGRSRCFDNVELRLWLDDNKQVVRHEVVGGRWLEKDEYERFERARASTLEDDRPGGGSASDIDESEKPGGNFNAR